MDKIQRATEIHRRMTPHQMALRIVEMEDDSAAAIEAVNAARKATAEVSAKFTEYNAKLADHDKRITELQDALELAEEAVRAKHSPDIAKMVSDGWQLVPVEPTRDMLIAINWPNNPTGYAIMLAAAPKLGGE